MIKLKIGQMLYDIRTEMQITQEELCHGLCTVSALSKYENGTRFPDSLLFHALMQRLGKSPGRINIMVSEQEAQYYEWKRKVLFAIKNQKWENVKCLREQGHEGSALINDILEKQFELYIDSVIYNRVYGNSEKSYECIKEAIHLTVPDIDTWDGKGRLISGDEMNMAFLYLREARFLGRKSSLEIREKFSVFAEYIETRVDDVFEKAKIYPRLVCAQMLLVGEEMRIKERIWMEKNALQTLKRTMEIYDMPEILRLLEIDLQNMEDAEAGVYKKQREILNSVIDQYSESYVFLLESWYDNNEKICLMNEYLRMNRMEKGLTQEALSEGICAVETYSRIESGKRAPSKKNYFELAERLDINWGYYRGQIITAHYKDYALMTELRLAMIRNAYDIAGELLLRLRRSLNLSYIENMQYIRYMELALRLKKGELRGHASIIEYQKVLSLSITDIKKVNRFFSKTEIELIVQIALAYRERKMYDKAIEILEIILKINGAQKFEIWQEVGVVRRFLGGCYLDIGDWEMGRKEILKLLRDMVENQDMQMLAEVIYILAWSFELENLENKKACGELYAKAFYLSDLVGNDHYKQIYKGKYEKDYDEEMQWY